MAAQGSKKENESHEEDAAHQYDRQGYGVQGPGNGNSHELPSQRGNSLSPPTPSSSENPTSDAEPESTVTLGGPIDETKQVQHSNDRSDDRRESRMHVEASGLPELSVDTLKANREAGARTQIHKRSPLGVSSPTSPNTSPSGDLPLSATISPRTRDRGFSLRRSLFARNISVQPQASGSTIELRPAVRFSTQQESLKGSSGSQFHKKLGTTISIASVSDEDKPTPRPGKETRTPSFLPHYETWVKDRAAQSVLLTSLKQSYQKVRKFMLRIHDISPSKDGRHIQLDASRKESLIDERTGRVYLNNVIRSSRYTLWNFLPRQLFAQFSKLANFYFLCVSILQMIPGLSTTGSYTTIVPLTFFVTLSIVKEGYDDCRRYRLDRAENNRLASVLHAYKPTVPGSDGTNEPLSPASAPKNWAEKKWKDVQVGDIVKLTRNDAAPADLVILHAKGVNGIAYIETMALDGETNLKSKQASPHLARSCGTVDEIAASNAHLVVEDPNLDLYNFEGKCTVANETLPLTNHEIIYRGSILRNTPELYGMVIYTGEECKIRMNATKNPRIKAPTLQAVVNKVVIIIVLFVLVLAIFNTIAYQIWYQAKEKKSWYLREARVAFFPILTSFIILFNTMIPLSLYVSLEIVKLFQMVLMNDIDMYDEDSNTPLEARTSTINEELGQVNYIFSDKTGTLTNNCMLFRKMSVAGTAWLHDRDIQERALANAVKRASSQKDQSKGKKPIRCHKSLSIRGQSRKDSHTSSLPGPSYISPIGRKSSASSRWQPSPRPNEVHHELRTAELLQYIQSKPHTLFARKARMLILSLALCHTCTPERSENGGVSYQAASPDEQALVQAAQELGYVMIDRQNGTITIKTNPSGSESDPSFEIYQILDVIEFSSNRKRMSIILRMPDNRICVFCKGADSTITKLLRLSGLAKDKAKMIERRVSKRQSLEAQEAIRRDSEHRNRKTSISRASLSLNRHSLGGIPRPNLAAKRLQPIRDDFDNWLRDRETDVAFSDLENQNAYSPRPSAHYPTDPVVSPLSGRSSFQDDERTELVEEAMVADDAAVFERCFQHINDFASEGLRTLLYGYRFLEEEEYESWKKLYLDASTRLSNRQEMMEKVSALVETNLELAGATAIEDKLQDGVPEAIDKLRRAKIKMWMLTGDKRETAINIGHSCRLIKDYSSITILDHETGDVEHRIAAAFMDINRGQVAHSVVVIDGQTLAIIEANDTIRKLFIELAILVDSVICCRASPSQKAFLVHAIRKKVKNAVTLAVGDGANDIAMIQEAHVGIGITGKEGLQAARTSDYSIAQFRFLLKLLLVHGRWNYIRTCKYTLGTFWKEMLFYLTQALYQRYAGYTGTSLYESWSLSMFNTLFTSLPVIFMGIFEKDLAATTLLAVPELYTLGHHNGGFNLVIYASWVFMASAEAMIIFFIMLGLYGQAIFTNDNGLYAMGTLTFSACVVIIATKLQFLDLHNKSITCVVAMFLSIGAWCLWNLILSAMYPKNVIYNVRDGVLRRFGRNALWWLTLILIVVSCWAFEIGVKCLRMAWAPGDVDVFQELEKDDGIRERLEFAAGWGMDCADGDDEDEDAKKKRVQEEEETRREEQVRELLERPRAVMGRGGTVRRRQPSDGSGFSHEQMGDSVGPSSGHDEMDGRSDVLLLKEDAEDNHDGKSKKPSIARRSVDVQELLRRGFGSVRRSLEVGSAT